MKKYSYRRKFKRVKGNGSTFWEEWSEKLYETKEEIDLEMKEQKEYEKTDKYMCLLTIDYEIKEVEIKELDIEGQVSDYGQYEDYTVVIGDARIESLIINKFKGQKIKVHIEVIE